jgi:hypothetical protein
MKVVKPTKSPSVQQLLNMAINLKEKFNKASMVEVKAWKFNSDKSEVSYRIYVENKLYFNYIAWQFCQDKYFSIMAAPLTDFPDEVQGE